jgi:hypothetical protein
MALRNPSGLWRRSASRSSRVGRRGAQDGLLQGGEAVEAILDPSCPRREISSARLDI